MFHWCMCRAQLTSVGILTILCLSVIPALAGEKIPVLYVTDLFQPHDDPDDHFDLATLFALDEFDILGIVVEHAEKQATRPGSIPVRQMMHITGRQVPCVVGLNPPLASPTDQGLTQPSEAQQGVALILDALRASERKVTIFTTGSMRDVAAAWNRDPDLMREKVYRVYMNIGHASPQESEWNVELDPHAYVCVMQSDLPLYWCPCFGAPYGTYWKFRQGDVLDTAPAMLQNFFLFALTTGSEWTGEPRILPPDPLSVLTETVDAAMQEAVFQRDRNMWCTAPFFHAAGRSIVELSPGRWAAVRGGDAATKAETVFDFVPARVTIDQRGRTAVREEGQLDETQIVAAFKVLDPDRYQAIMTSCLKELFRESVFPAVCTTEPGIRLRAENLTLLPQSQPVAAVRVHNARAETYAGNIALGMPHPWRLAPDHHAVQVAQGEEQRLTFSVQGASESTTNVYPVEITATSGSAQIAHRQDIRVATAPYFRPTIDGDSEDWKDAVPVTFATNGRKTIISTYWHRRAFYILVAVEEDTLCRPGEGEYCDAVQVALAPRGSRTARSADAEAERFEFLLVPGPDTTGVCYGLAAPDTNLQVAGQPRTLASLSSRAAELVVRRVEGVTYYECGLPWDDMRSSLQPAEGREFCLSVLVHDPDGTGIRDWGEAAGLWESQRTWYAWSKWQGARWSETPPMDNRIEWGLCSSRY